MTAVDRIFGFYGVIWDFFTLPEVTAILDEHAATEQAAAEQEALSDVEPDTDPDAEPYVDWAAIIYKISHILAPFGQALYAVTDGISDDLSAWERWRRRPEAA